MQQIFFMYFKIQRILPWNSYVFTVRNHSKIINRLICFQYLSCWFRFRVFQLFLPGKISLMRNFFVVYVLFLLYIDVFCNTIKGIKDIPSIYRTGLLINRKQLNLWHYNIFEIILFGRNYHESCLFRKDKRCLCTWKRKLSFII